MSRSIDLPPINDKIVDKDGFLTDIWRDWFGANIQSIIEFITQSGIILPSNTTTEIAAIIAPQMFSMIGNKTTGEPQIYLGSWKNILHS